MGLAMISVHEENLKQKVKQLGDRRSRIESEIESISARLQTPGQPGLAGNLVDADVSLAGKSRVAQHGLFRSMSERLFRLHCFQKEPYTDVSS